MSDTAQGAGWWLASDGKWYPPELHPNYTPPPSAPTPPTPTTPTAPGVGSEPPGLDPVDLCGQLLEVTTALRIALLQFAGEVERLERAVRELPGSSIT
jgi:hypothetical protein